MRPEEVSPVLIQLAERTLAFGICRDNSPEPGATCDCPSDAQIRVILAAVLPEIVAKAYEEAADTVAREVDVVWPSQRNEKASYAAEVLRANARAVREGKPAPYATRLTATTEEPTT